MLRVYTDASQIAHGLPLIPQLLFHEIVRAYVLPSFISCICPFCSLGSMRRHHGFFLVTSMHMLPSVEMVVALMCSQVVVVAWPARHDGVYKVFTI